MPRYSTKVKPYPNNIKEIIKMQGYRIKDVAEALNMPRATLTDYITGNRPAPRECLAHLAEFIGCNIEVFHYFRAEVVSTSVESMNQSIEVRQASKVSTKLVANEDTKPVSFSIVQLEKTPQNPSILLYPVSLTEVSPVDCTTWFSEKLSEVIALVTQWQKSADVPNFQKMLDRELRVFDKIRAMFEANEYFLSRRSALLVIATLPGGLIHLLQSAKASLIEEDFLPACAASITACWYLLNGKEFASIERTLSKYLPFLMLSAKQSSRYQQTAAYLAAQGCMLLSLVASHQLQLQQRLLYCRETVKYAKSTGDAILLVKALTMIGNALYDQKSYHEMLQSYQEALFILNKHPYTIPAVLQSKVYMGLAHAHAQHGQSAEALNAISKARTIFPAGNEDVPVFLSSDDGLFSLILFEGWVRLDLGKIFPEKDYYQQATQSLIQIENTSDATLVPERIRIEILNRQAQAAVATGNLESFQAYMFKGVEGLKTVKSEKRYQEIVENYRAARKKWPHESKVLELAEVLL